jgi:hypothetical protein
MPLCFLLDENLRGPLWHAVHRHNVAGGLPIDVARVGDSPDLPLASSDGQILAWCAQGDRILVSLDHETLPGHLTVRLSHGEHSPGVFLIRSGSSLRDVVDALELVAHAGDPAEYRDRVTYLP